MLGHRLVGMGTIICCVAAMPAEGEIIRRVDESGTVFYSNIPPAELEQGARFSLLAGPSRFHGLIQAAARDSGLDPRLITAVIQVESGFNPWAVSSKGAMGLMQLMPKTATRYGVRNPFDPRENIWGGTQHLRDLLEHFDGNLSLALAAYNAGPRAVRTAGGVPPFPETQRFVRRILARYGSPHTLIAFRARSGTVPERDPPRTRVYRLRGKRGIPLYTNLPPTGALRRVTPPPSR